jgi:hypothetical protein
VEVVLIHYGERSEMLARELRGRGALLNELCLYERQLPEDTQPMMVLVEDVVAGRVDGRLHEPDSGTPSAADGRSDGRQHHSSMP